jgi:hypothetical protein
VGSRLDDWLYWTSLLQLQLVIRAHTLNSLITNLSLHFFWFSGWSLVFYYSRFLSSWSELSTLNSGPILSTPEYSNDESRRVAHSSEFQFSMLCRLYSHSLDVAVPSNWFPYTDAARTRIKENACHVIATQPVH